MIVICRLLTEKELKSSFFVLLGHSPFFILFIRIWILQTNNPCYWHRYVYVFYLTFAFIAVYFSELVKEEDSYEMLVKKSKAAAIRYEQMKQMMK